MKLSDLKENPTNPRLISKKAFDGLKKSINDFGDISGIVYNRRTEQLVAGHQRRKALLAIGDLEIVITKTFKEPSSKGTVAVGYIQAGDETVNYREVDWDVMKERKANILANSPFIAGEYDVELLAEDLEILKFEPDYFDFNLDELEEKDLSDDKQATDDDYDLSKGLAKPLYDVKLGDVWELGAHRLICGSSTDFDTVDKLFAGSKADLVITDPPYNVNYEGKTKSKLKINNDHMEGGDFYQFLLDFYANVFSFLRDGGGVYVFHADIERVNFTRAFQEAGLKLSQVLIWAKNSIVMGRQDYHWKHEPIIYGWKEGAAHSWESDRTQSTILEFDRPSRNAEHPTMKPIELVGYLMKNSSKAGGIVFDGFGGSGSTLIAAEQLGRSCLMIELDPRYCSVIIERWEKLTNQKANLQVDTTTLT
jgi:DNA modification methylase